MVCHIYTILWSGCDSQVINVIAVFIPNGNNKFCERAAFVQNLHKVGIYSSYKCFNCRLLGRSVSESQPASHIPHLHTAQSSESIIVLWKFYNENFCMSHIRHDYYTACPWYKRKGKDMPSTLDRMVNQKVMWRHPEWKCGKKNLIWTRTESVYSRIYHIPDSKSLNGQSPTRKTVILK